MCNRLVQNPVLSTSVKYTNLWLGQCSHIKDYTTKHIQISEENHRIHIITEHQSDWNHVQSR